ncbi:AN1-type zinc finger protein 2A isoform 2-T2 [Vipera latastei]
MIAVGFFYGKAKFWVNGVFDSDLITLITEVTCVISGCESGCCVACQKSKFRQPLLLGNHNPGKFWASEEMEFPDLGQHCCEKTCRRLDFLPLKCDACQELFCKDHITYSQHKCSSAYKKDVQVPVCPLCNTPVPVRKGEMPDVAVGAHMDQDCQQDSAQQKQKIFTNKCFKGGCRKKEMMRLVCDQCHQNFCLHHRHPLDHNCPGWVSPVSKAGCAAIMRSLKSRNNSPNCPFLQNGELKS